MKEKNKQDTVLIIDDEPLICKTLAAILENKGFDVTHTASGGEGLESFKNGFKIVILDLKLPDISGIEVLRQIKKQVPETIVILVTAYASVATAVTAMNEGAFTYLTKPFEVDELMRVIKDACDEQNEESRRMRLINNLSLLYKVSKKLEGEIELHSISKLAARYFADVVDINVCAILLPEKEGKGFNFIALSGVEFDRSQLEPKRFLLEEQMYTRLVLEHNAVLIPQLKVKPQILEYIPVKNPHSMFIFPLVLKKKLVGLALFVGEDGLSLSEETLERISTVSIEVAQCIRNANRYVELKKNYLETVTSLVSSIESKNNDPKNSRIVSARAELIAHQMGLPRDEIEYIRIAALLHDVGKVAISEQILLKEDALTTEELVKMKTHSLVSSNIVQSIDTDHRLIPIILHHHERFDGQGYPDGLQGEAIPVGARILAICDAYEAMISNRPYRYALNKEEALGELQRCSGSQFDPEIVKVLIEILGAEEKDNEKK